MSRRWTDEEEAWLRAEYGRGHVADVQTRFADKFGRRPSLQSLYQKAYKLGLLCGKIPLAPERAVRQVRWSKQPKMQAWMEEHDKGQSVPLLSYEFSSTFGFPLSRPQITLWRAVNSRQVRNSHGGGRDRSPVGSERESKGYIWVKVDERPRVPQTKDNWRQKHVVVYEKAYGKVPDGCQVVFANRNMRDFRPENLVAVPKKLIARLNAPDCPGWNDAETLRSAMASVELGCRISRAEAALPRACGVCGREFVPPVQVINRSRAGRLQQTCPECISAGKKARGNRTVKDVRRCHVCGREYGATAKNQTRCSECIAQSPKASVKAMTKRKEVHHE